MHQAASIEEVITILDNIIQEAEASENPLGYFAALYRKVTIRVKEVIDNNYFSDGARTFINKPLKKTEGSFKAGGGANPWPILTPKFQKKTPAIFLLSIKDCNFRRPASLIKNHPSMPEVTSAQAKDIAQDLQLGMICYVDKTTGKHRTLLPAAQSKGDEIWETERENIQMHHDQYIRIDPMPSFESYGIMEDFVETISDETVRKKLEKALAGSKPFHAFRFVVDEIDLRHAFFEYQQQCYENWVILQLSREGRSEEEE